MTLQLDAGRTIAYIGGLCVSASSLAAKAEHAEQVAQQAANVEQVAQSISLLQMNIAPVLEITVGDVTTLGGFAIVVARFAWDVFKARRAGKSRDERSQ